MAEWSRIVNTTIKDYLRGEEDKLMANRKLLAMLKKSGNIEYNKGGDSFEWKVRYQRAPMTVNNGEQTLNFARVDRTKSASLDYQGYAIVDSMTKRERLKNRGPAAIIKVYENMIPDLMEDLEEKFSEELYIDSSASGNSGRLSGIETFLGYTQTVNLGTGAARSANAGDVVAYPSDTYAGLSTILGNYAGTWNATVTTDTSTKLASTWPAGTGDESYDFYSPTIVNYTSTAFGGSSATWAVQCRTALRYAIIHSQRYKSKKGLLDTFLLDRGLYREFAELYEPTQRIAVTNSTGLRALGFEDTMMLDGCEITWEFGIPTSVGYGFNIDQMTLRSMQDKLFEAEGPEYDMASKSWRVAIDFLGQLKFQSPRFFSKVAAIA